MSRDLIAALWPASYKGVPFYVEKDTQEGGRRLAIHEFYGRDDPYIEDLGARARHYQTTIYLASDTYDSDSVALIATLTSEGPGALVRPLEGPVQCRLETFSRSWEKDRIGYAAFAVHFYRDGSAVAVASVGSLAQLAFDAVTSLVAASAPSVAGLVTLDQPSWVVAAAIADTQAVVATLDDLRAAAVTDPATSVTLAASLKTFYQALPTLLSPLAVPDPSVVPTLAGLAVSIADAMTPASAAASFGALFDGVVDVPPVDPARSGNAAQVAVNAQAIVVAARLAYLAGFVEAIMVATYSSRQEAIAVRADCVERFDVAFESCIAPGSGADLYITLQIMRNGAVAYLSNMIANLAPVVTIGAPTSLPVLWWAWRLYQDPTRAADLLARNDVAHPSFMPLQFEALAPSATTLLPVAA